MWCRATELDFIWAAEPPSLDVSLADHLFPDSSIRGASRPLFAPIQSDNGLLDR